MPSAARPFTRRVLDALLARGVAILPIGILEKHGPQGPIGSDLIRAREWAARVVKQELHNQLQATSDHAAALKLLRRVQDRSVELGPDAFTSGNMGSAAPTSPPA